MRQAIRLVPTRLGTGLQSNRKVVEGAADHPARDAQFQWIADQTATLQATNQSVISVDSKKQELVGDFKKEDRRGFSKGSPRW